MAERGTFDSPNWASTRTPSSRPASTRSTGSHRASSRTSDESTPLLARDNSGDRANDDSGQRDGSPAATSLLQSIQGRPGAKRKWPWPSIIALLLLCAFTVVIMLLGFFVPEVMEEYAMQAKEFDIQSISLPEFTPTGARARIQGVFWMNAANVKRKSVRDLGVFGTWVAKKVKSQESTVKVSLPDYDNAILGTAVVPPIELDIQSGHRNDLDFLVDLEPGDVEGVRAVANDWLDGRLEKLTLQGTADVKLRSGILSLGTQSIAQSLVIQGEKIPEMPSYNISRLTIHEVNLTDGSQAMAADASIIVQNNYPLDLDVPPLAFGILVDNCLPTDPRIMVADAAIKDLHIYPQQDVQIDVSGLVRRLPDALTSDCPGTLKSPLDSLLGGYMHGEKTTIYVTGSDSPSVDTPKWISDLTSSVTVPVPVPGRSFGSLVRNFSLSDVHFSLPDPLAEPDSPESYPQISAKINVLVAMPEEMNFDVDITKVRAKAKVYYHDKELGILNLKKWQPSNATRIAPHGKEHQPTLLIQSNIKDAPLQITNDTLFTEVVQALLFSGKPVLLAMKADVDAKIVTALGKVTIREVPGEGVVPIKPISSGKGSGKTPGFGFPSLNQSVGDLQIVNTTLHSLTLQAKVNFTNPTKYSATIPYVDINLLVNDTILGHVTARNISIVPGNNTNVTIQATWDPSAHSANGTAVGRELLSRYISGYNTSITLQTHPGTIPYHPGIGRALEVLKLVVPAPRLQSPRDPDDPDDPDNPNPPDNPGEGDGDEDESHRPRFIREAVLHIWSSTAQFILASPFTTTTLYINHVNATAYYKDDVVGHIYYGEDFSGEAEEFEVPPGLSQTPRLPVEFKLGSVGYGAIRKALGGGLRLRAESTVGVRVGEFVTRVWYKGRRVHAKVRV